jgi:hypothetical protein
MASDYVAWRRQDAKCRLITKSIAAGYRRAIATRPGRPGLRRDRRPASVRLGRDQQDRGEQLA